MSHLTTSEKRIVGQHIRNRYDGARNIRFGADGAVSVTVDAMPNTNVPGRIFAGWDTELLREVRREQA